MAPEVTIRRYEPRDYDVVVPMWQAGFHEMTKYTYQTLTSKPHFFVASAVAASAVYALGLPKAAASVLAFGASIYTPFGKWFLDTLMWQAIYAQTRGSMQPKHLVNDWNVEGKSAFFVAVLRDTSADPTGAAPAGQGSRDGQAQAPAERVVGCVGVKAIHTLHGERFGGVWTTPGEASIWRLTVDPDIRKGGIGRLLMAQAEAWAKDNGCRHMSLLTGNPESQRFYKRLGYSVEREDRASRVLFGQATGGPQAGSGATGDAGEKAAPSQGGIFTSIRKAVKVRFLRGRLNSRGSILVKELA